MNKLSTVLAVLICTGLLVMPLRGLANGDFRIENKTHKKLSFKINHFCSKAFGVIRPGKTKVVSKAAFKEACKQDEQNCIADLYHSGNCMGEHVATLKLRTDAGLAEVIAAGPYAFSWRPFQMIVIAAIP